jgi:hypothetical protein
MMHGRVSAGGRGAHFILADIAVAAEALHSSSAPQLPVVTSGVDLRRR